MRMNDFLRRIYAIGERSGTGCWEWDGARIGAGYGAVAIGGKQHKVTRLLLGLPRAVGHKGPWALHRCDNPPCCNPDHLYIGTPTDNNRDTIRRRRRKDTRKTHCKRGHELTGDNVLPAYQRAGEAPSGRRCKACTMMQNEASRQRHGRAWYERWREKNPRKGPRPKPTHCPQGHEYTPENIRLDTHAGRTTRKCRECDRQRAARQRERAKAS